MPVLLIDGRKVGGLVLTNMNIDFLCASPLASAYPPVPSKKLTPEWYKDLGTFTDNKKDFPTAKEVNTNRFCHKPTVKKCMPVMDYITSGYIIRSHIDIAISKEWSNEQGEQIWFDNNKALGGPAIQFHHPGQFPLIRNGHQKQLLKFLGAWGIKTPSGYSCLFYQPEYFLETRWKFLPGIIDTDDYTMPINFPFVLDDSKETQNYTIPAGTPLVCVLPFKRETWSHNIKEWNPNDFAGIKMRAILKDVYKKFMHKIKDFN